VAEEVDGHREAHVVAGRQHVLRQGQIELTRGVHVDEDRLSAGAQHGERGGEGRERRGQHAVTRSQPGAAQAELDGVEARGAAHAMGEIPPLGELRLEGAHLGAEDQPPAGPHPVHRGQGGLTDPLPLGPEVVERDELQAGSHRPWRRARDSSMTGRSESPLAGDAAASRWISSSDSLARRRGAVAAPALLFLLRLQPALPDLLQQRLVADVQDAGRALAVPAGAQQHAFDGRALGL
jgi:hypothetical protein